MTNIKVTYIIVFISLVFWASFAYFTMHEQIKNQQKYAKLINISGKQRMLSQKTTLISKRVYETNDTELVKHLHQLIEMMKKDHTFLINNLTSTKMEAIYLEKPFNLNNKVEKYFELLDQFYEKKDITTLQQIEQYSFKLLGTLHHAVNAFEKESDEHTDVLMDRELLIFLGTLLTLLIESLLIIKPTIRQLDESKIKMTKFNQQLEEKIEEQRKKILQNAIEKEKIQKKVQEQERHLSMGEMIKNIAHQWRQPLSVISTAASGMKMQKEYDILKDADFFKLCDSITDQAQYLSKTINDFSNFVNTDKVKTTYNLNDDIINIANLMKESLQESDIDLQLSLKNDIVINGYENELTQSLINILHNAKEALLENRDKNKFISITTKSNDENIVIKIKDNGGGIKEEILSKIFDPYFTTKHKSQGTGLGLHLAYKYIVHTMKGNIKVKNVTIKHNNEIFKGTKITISLPIS